MKNERTKTIVLCALFVAVICIVSQMAIPFTLVPLTLQTFGVALCGYILGAKKGTLCVLAYLLLGLCGAPVFSRFQGGAPVLFGYTGGFLIGFLFLVFLCGCSDGTKSKISFGIGGIVLCHLLGVIQFSLVSGNPFLASFLIASAPYLLKDVLCVAFAQYCAKKINFRRK